MVVTYTWNWHRRTRPIHVEQRIEYAANHSEYFMYRSIKSLRINNLVMSHCFLMAEALRDSLRRTYAEWSWSVCLFVQRPVTFAVITLKRLSVVTYIRAVNTFVSCRHFNFWVEINNYNLWKQPHHHHRHQNRRRVVVTSVTLWCYSLKSVTKADSDRSREPNWSCAHYNAVWTFPHIHWNCTLNNFHVRMFPHTMTKRRRRRRKCDDLKCVRKPTNSRLSLTHHANKSSRWE